jgi:hypothetical protein
MSAILQIYWPLLIAAFLAGIIAGRFAFRRAPVSDDASVDVRNAAADAYRRRRNKRLLIGFGALLAGVALWHGPLGGGERFARSVEGAVAAELKWLEMPMVSGRLDRSPLRRTLVLAGPVNDFQQSEFVRILRPTRGVSSIRWEASETSRFALPLLVEVALLSLLTFALGLFFSFIVEVRRRVNADWSW